jgi:hypothetical protein
MIMLRRTLLAVLIGAGALTAGPVGSTSSRAAVASLPDRLSDSDFWSLSASFSEAGGQFHSDNFVSNEGRFQSVIPDLVRRVTPGGLYLGVGPEQNFTYIAAVRPAMAFIVDIRRANLHEHLLYKALFEMSSNRLEFLARLFSRPVPKGLDRDAPVEELFAALETSVPTESLYRQNLADVTAWLSKRHRLPLTEDDLAGIDYVYRTAFFADGPELNYRLTGGGIGRGGTPSYAQLMAMDDGAGRQRSYLATEQNFSFVKSLQSRNLIVPVVGDFGGTTALRAIGRYARSREARVTAFYLSNVEQYLRPAGTWESFCANVASMPLDDSSTFIRSFRGGRGDGQDGWFVRFTSSLGSMVAETAACALPASARVNQR